MDCFTLMLTHVHARMHAHTTCIQYLVRSLGSEIIAETTSDGATALHFASGMNLSWHSTLLTFQWYLCILMPAANSNGPLWPCMLAGCKWPHWQPRPVSRPPWAQPRSWCCGIWVSSYCYDCGMKHPTNYAVFFFHVFMCVYVWVCMCMCIHLCVWGEEEVWVHHMYVSIATYTVNVLYCC